MIVTIGYPKRGVCFFMAACIIASAFGQSNKTVSVGPPVIDNVGVSLKIGDDAPAIQYARWLKGTPINVLDKNNIYVVEFWATWCGPCKKLIPHLSAQAKKYAGKITFVSFAILEQRSGGGSYDESLGNLTKFVKAQGDSMNYHVAADTKDSFMLKNWFFAAGQHFIPVSYIVQNNKILRIDNSPTDSLLDAVLSGKYDMQTAVTEYYKALADKNSIEMLMKSFNGALQQLDFTKAAAELDKVLPKLPYNAALSGNGRLFRVLAKFGKPDELITAVKRWRAWDTTSSYSSFLFSISNYIAFTDGLSPAAYQLGLEYAKELLSFQQKKGIDEAYIRVNLGFNYRNMAQCDFKLHNIPEAISLQQKYLDWLKEKTDHNNTYSVEDNSNNANALIKIAQRELAKYKAALK